MFEKRSRASQTNRVVSSVQGGSGLSKRPKRSGGDVEVLVEKVRLFRRFVVGAPVTRCSLESINLWKCDVLAYLCCSRSFR